MRTFSASSLEEYLKKAFLRSAVVSLTEEEVPTSFSRKALRESFFFKKPSSFRTSIRLTSGTILSRKPIHSSSIAL